MASGRDGKRLAWRGVVFGAAALVGGWLVAWAEDRKDDDGPDGPADPAPLRPVPTEDGQG